MPNIQPSPPFNLAPHDWKSLGYGAAFAVIAAIGGYATATVIPTLKEHTANDSGVLIVTILTAVIPVLLNMGKKYFTDTTTVVKLLVLAVGLSICSVAGAAEYGPNGSINIPIIGPMIDKLLSNWWGMPVLILAGILVVTKGFKFDLSKMVLPIAVRFLTWILTPPAAVPLLMAIAPPADSKATEAPALSQAVPASGPAQ